MLPIRHVARVILVDAADSVLLCRYTETVAGRATCYWVPPGGALEAGEDHPVAALREVCEETGLTVQLGPQLWERRFVLQQQGGAVDQIERYFLARLSTLRPAVANSSAEDIQELRWWSLAELRSTAERVYPDGLADLISGQLAVRASPGHGNPRSH